MEANEKRRRTLHRRRAKPAIAIYFLFAFVFAGFTGAAKPDRSPVYENYIRQYRSLAVKQQEKYRIPACITLAQGLLESGAGQSELARKSKNHFGIKCHSDWRGGRVYADDDRKGECFRKYKSVEDSYEDHSRFLSGSSRYANLFKMDINDYKGWARGLQQSGYATNPAYADRLIKLIEDYDLCHAPATGKEKKTKFFTLPPVKRKPASAGREIHKSRGLKYVYAGDNDSYKKIADETGTDVQTLVKYNEAPASDFLLKKGDVVYLGKKRKKAHKPYYDHVVQAGESMYDISQKYGVEVKSLYEINKKTPGYVPAEGDVLKLR